MKLRELRERAEKAQLECDGANSWAWSQTYEIGDGEFHWCLIDPDGDGERTIDLFTITYGQERDSIAGLSFACEQPVPAFIASASPMTVLALLDDFDRMRKALADGYDEQKELVTELDARWGTE